MKTLFSNTIGSLIQYVMLAIWVLFQIVTGFFNHFSRAGRRGYYKVMVWRRRLKKEPLWQQQDWTFLGIPPPEDHPEYNNIVLQPLSDEELAALTEDEIRLPLVKK